MEYKMTIHNAKEELPQKSGTYLVKTSDHFNVWQVLSYSAKFKKFNTYDSQDNDKDAIDGYMWTELPGEDSEVESATCPDCNGSGVYQEYDEHDRYHVYTCYKCEGTGEIARQSVTSEEVAEAISWAQGMEIYYEEKQMPECANCAKTAVAALQAYQPWIPVSERLPEREEHYLCCEMNYPAIFVAYYGASGWQRPLYRETTVTHWKPLTEPPKGE